MLERSFASDNNSGVSPEVLAALAQANQGHVVAYGSDPFTVRAEENIRQHFGDRAQVYFVFNGTAANVLCLKALTESYNAVICSDLAHIHLDECGAPEKMTGCKLLPVPAPDGKLTVKAVASQISGVGDQHHVQPKVISLTQATEVGTVYDEKEIAALSEFARKNKMFIHMDGARLSNAVVSLNSTFKRLTADAGVDAVSFGGTKNGLMGAEAVILLNPDRAEHFKFFRKQSMQLSSKMRFIAAQFDAYLTGDLWKKNATHSNSMAQILGNKLKGISPLVQVTQKVQANGVFVKMPNKILPELLKKTFFYVWRPLDGDFSEVRLMCSFDTIQEDIQSLVGAIENLVGQN